MDNPTEHNSCSFFELASDLVLDRLRDCVWVETVSDGYEDVALAFEGMTLIAVP